MRGVLAVAFLVTIAGGTASGPARRVDIANRPCRAAIDSDCQENGRESELCMIHRDELYATEQNTRLVGGIRIGREKFYANPVIHAPPDNGDCRCH